MRLFNSTASAAIRLGAIAALLFLAGIRTAGAAQPDLAPAVPTGFSANAVVSNSTGNTQGTSIFTTDKVFLNFGYANQGGDIPASTTFNISVTLDSTVVPNAVPAQAGITGGTVVAVKDILIGSSLAAGTHSVTVVLNSGPNPIAESNTANDTIQVSFNVMVSPPVIDVNTLTATATAGRPFTYQISASNNPTSYNATNLPTGLSIDTSTGVISGNPAVSGTVQVSISASNAGGTDTETLTLTINPIAPSITSPLVAHGSLGVQFVYNVTATGAPTPTFSVTNLPPGLSFGASAITGAPLQAGTTSVVITASNAGGTDSKTVVVDITAPPVITSSLVVGGAVGDTSFSYQIVAAPNVTSYSTGSLPPGLLAVDANGVIKSGPNGPTAAGTYIVSLTALNTLNGTNSPCVYNNTVGTATATATFAISSTIGAPAITSPLTASGVETTPFAYGITSTNMDATTTFSASIPSGLSGLMVDTKTGLISGLPGLLPGTFPVPPQVYPVTITATNSKGSGSATLNITINPAIPTITSNVTGQFTVIAQVPFQYQITATSFTDPGVGPTLFSGNFPIPSGNISVSQTSGLMSGTPLAGVPPNGDAGNYTVTITAQNNRGSNTLTFEAVVASQLPSNGSGSVSVIVFPGPYNAVAIAGCPFNLPINASGAECYRLEPNGTFPNHLVLDLFGSLSGTPQLSDVKSSPPYSFTIGASIFLPGTDHTLIQDCEPDKAQATYTLAILSSPPVTVPPVITSLTNNLVTVGTPFNYTIVTTPDITLPTTPLPLLYSSTALPQGLAITPDSIMTLGNPPGVITGVPSIPGSIAVAVTALNAAGSDTKVVTITVAHVVITSPLAVTAQIGQPFSYQITASGNSNVFDATGLPAGLSISPSGLISGIPVDIAGQVAPIPFAVALSASNPYDTAHATLNLTVDPAPAGSPVITSVLTATGEDQVPFNYQIVASNSPDGFNASGLPGGLLVDKVSGNIFGKPTQVGTFNVIILATASAITDGAGAAILVLTIKPAPAVITSPLNVTAVVGQPFLYQFTATGTPAITFSNVTPLPAGLTLSGAMLSGVFTAGGVYSITFQASNAANPPDSEVLTIIVTQAPAITSPLTASAQVNVPFSYIVTASGTAPITFTATPLPDGLTFDGTTIGGAPTTSTPAFNITLTATNTAGKDVETLVVAIAPSPPPPPPSITSPLSANGMQGTPFTYQISSFPAGTAFGASGLPTGLSVNPTTGLISGTPAASGTFSVPLTSVTSLGQASATLTLTIGSGSPIITSLNAEGVQAAPFTLVLTAQGTQPIVFTAANLPAGLVLSNGTISGIPTVFGTFEVTLTAQNSFGTDTETLIITLAQEPDDVDGDGFPNDLEILLGTNPLDPNSTPFNGKMPLLSRVLNVTNTTIRLNFASAGKDSIAVKGTFTVIPGFITANQATIFIIGNLVQKFTLDGNGSFTSPGSSYKFKLKGVPDASGNVTGNFMVRLDNGSFSGPLKAQGLTGNATLNSASRTVRMFLLFPGALFLYDSQKVLTYTVRAGRSGTAKQVSPYSVK